mmetsp:Transcript_33039/g.84377  ORF Transcript_33039/g.84377 Transcript_33039/m.84377 type:complete len:366 (+) Transcript_33039:94-1191(+)
MPEARSHGSSGRRQRGSLRRRTHDIDLSELPPLEVVGDGDLLARRPSFADDLSLDDLYPSRTHTFASFDDHSLYDETLQSWQRGYWQRGASQPEASNRADAGRSPTAADEHEKPSGPPVIFTARGIQRRENLEEVKARKANGPSKMARALRNVRVSTRVRAQSPNGIKMSPAEAGKEHREILEGIEGALKKCWRMPSTKPTAPEVFEMSAFLGLMSARLAREAEGGATGYRELMPLLAQALALSERVEMLRKRGASLVNTTKAAIADCARVLRPHQLRQLEARVREARVHEASMRGALPALHGVFKAMGLSTGPRCLLGHAMRPTQAPGPEGSEMLGQDSLTCARGSPSRWRAARRDHDGRGSEG